MLRAIIAIAAFASTAIAQTAELPAEIDNIQLAPETSGLPLELDNLERAPDSIEATPIEVPTVRVGIITEEPFVIEKDPGHYAGSDIETLRIIADNADWNVEYVTCDRFADLFTLLEDGEVDAIMSGITITLDRERKFDFTHPYMSTGLGIMIAEDTDKTFPQIISEWIQVRIPLMIELLLICLGFILVLVFFGFLLYVTDDQRKADAEVGGRLTLMEVIRGTSASTWLAFMTGSTIGFGDITPRSPLAKFISVLCFFSMAMMIGLMISSMTSFSISQQLAPKIMTAMDLEGANVAVVDGSTSVDEVHFYGGITKKYDNYDECIASLILGKTDAVVGDVPNLAYFANDVGSGAVTLSDSIFAPQKYGIAFAENSPFVEQANLAILASQDDIDEINQRYFGH